MKHKMKPFVGKIKIISSSPHGDPEGVVLDGGTFIKIPPHSLLNASKIKVGAVLSGEGEQIAKSPNAVFHRVSAKIGKVLVSNDQGKPHEREAQKENHKKAIEKKKKTEAKAKPVSLNGEVISVGLKPKGEIDRIIFSDGTSVHLAKEIELNVKKIHLGDHLNVTGESREFKNLKFVKAKTIHEVNAS